MAGMKFLGITVLKSGAEKDIRTLFENSMTRLTEQRSKLLDDITEWSDALIHSIYKHANHQRYLVEQEFTAQMQNLNNSLRDFIEELHVYEKRNDDNRTNELLSQCRALKFELSALETNGQSIPFIEAPNRGNLPIINEDEQCVTGYERPSFDDASIANRNGKLKEPSHRHPSSSHPQQSINNSKQIDRSQTVIVNSAYTDGNGIDDDSLSRSLPEKKTNLVEKCPICYMIYPKTMNANSRREHIFEHDNDK